MRMWMVDPARMCDQHLLGEHVELHMLVGTLLRKRSIAGFIEKQLVEVHSVRVRHKQLVLEMARRGMKHRSPLPAFRARRIGAVDPIENLRELARRCAKCRKLQAASETPCNTSKLRSKAASR